MNSFEKINNQEAPVESNARAFRGVEEEEKTLLEKFKGKARHVAAVLAMTSALSIGAGFFEQSYAAEKGKEGTKVEQVDKEKVAEEKAIELFFILQNMPDTKDAVNSAQNELMKEEAARRMILEFALEKKLGFPERKEGENKIEGNLTLIEIKDALETLDNSSGLFADRAFGNKDGHVDLDEIKMLQEQVGKNVGLRAFMEMQMDYHDVHEEEGKTTAKPGAKI